ncbi:hypothetical protein G7Y89_g12297 [Cudoniella acicularis]|uniref:Yeast cell wall synthesis Kre9/Knh1-like N-terminal domain-containing protein n=1 Tax=Cudoniella acicularis TaxID=354080 RepID=A0A8H4R9B7_9HELO|nr:hypothetical protein G7Y89_g12297 [Cudoniella acicularis]
MLTLYKPPPSGAVETKKVVIPAGRPYLTKVNGKLVMARDKKDKSANVALDLLGEAFGVPKVVRKKSKSISAPSPPLLIAGTPYIAQQQVPAIPYSTPIPQRPFPVGPFVAPQYPPMLPQIPYQPPNPPNPTPTPTRPTPQDFERLKHIDAHFNKYVIQDSEVKIKSPKKVYRTEETVTKTTITITKHICANCGRLRSKSYHKEHPIRDGETPAAAFCRKCQRDSSSTSSSSRHKKSKKKSKSKKHKRESRSSSESSRSPEPKERRKSTREEGRSRYVRDEDIITVEVEHSGDDARSLRKHRKTKDAEIMVEINRRKHRSRSRSRSRGRKVYREVSEVRMQTVSPRPRNTVRYVSPSGGAPEYYERPRRSTVGSREESRRRSPPVTYRHVRAPSVIHKSRDRGSRSVSIAEEEEDDQKIPVWRTGRKIPIHFFEDDAPEPMAPPRRISYAEPASPRILNTERSFESETMSSTRSRERRRRERRSATQPSAPLIPLPEIHPKKDDGLAVVTEKYFYRPKKQLDEERRLEEGRRQEYIDRVTMKGRYRTKDFSAEEAARYYREDWANGGQGPVASRKRVDRRGYRRDRYQDSELTDSEASYRTDPYRNPPRVPTPPSPLSASSKVGNYQGPPYPLSSDSELTSRRAAIRKGKEVQRPSHLDRELAHQHSRSQARPPFVREATDRGTEKALVPSPRRDSMESVYFPSSVSEATERRRYFIDERDKHVKFKEEVSDMGTVSEWTTTEISGSGWAGSLRNVSGIKNALQPVEESPIIKMQFARLLAIAASAISVVSAVQFTNSVFNNVTAGEPFTFTWTNATGPVSLVLKNGASTNLQTVSTITSGASGTSFTWSVPANLPADTYAIAITDSAGTNYSPQFQLVGATATASTSSSTASSTASSSVSSSASSVSSSSASSSTASSASTTASISGNSTSSATGSTSSGSASKTSSTSASKTSSASTSTGTSSVPNTNSASDFASPLALVFLTVAALISLN